MSAANTALAGLYEAHAGELHGFARRRAGRQEAEDVVQDAYLHLLQRGTAATLEHPRAYLFCIAANLAVDLARKTKIRLRYAGEGFGLDCMRRLRLVPKPPPEVRWSCGGS
jgi:RNA polymerase sigma-70 factor (ECF subfamily)